MRKISQKEFMRSASRDDVISLSDSHELVAVTVIIKKDEDLQPLVMARFTKNKKTYYSLE